MKAAPITDRKAERPKISACIRNLTRVLFPGISRAQTTPLSAAAPLVTTTMRSERFFTKLEQTHARNFLKETVEHVLLANPKPCVKHLPNTCLFKNP
jgi:hypothetical protein